METARGAAAPRAPTHGAPGAGVPVAHRGERAALVDRTDRRRDHHSRRPRVAEARLGPEADPLPPLKAAFHAQPSKGSGPKRSAWEHSCECPEWPVRAQSGPNIKRDVHLTAALGA